MRNILVLCENNAGLSIMIEAAINAKGGLGWNAASAGHRVAPQFNRYAILAMREAGLPMPKHMAPRGWHHFATAASPRFDIVLTLSENIAWEEMPDWPGAPRLLHWALPDPLAVPATADERLETFKIVLELAGAKVETLLEDEHRAERLLRQANDNVAGNGGSSRRYGT
ncbi:MAG: hypothetical protein KDJ37_04205 [Hyphomicrobiaceae bacterium]|nr:hypothetical protein [Hyphomicrobiaceae bacterium]